MSQNIELEPLTLPRNLQTILNDAYNQPLTREINNEDMRRQWNHATTMFIKTKQKIEKTDKELSELINKRKKLESDLLKHKDTLNRLDRVIISDIHTRRNTVIT